MPNWRRYNCCRWAAHGCRPRWLRGSPAEIGCQLQQVFGMAEGLVNYTRLDDPLERITHTRGRPMCPDDEVWVADENSNPLPAGQVERPDDARAVHLPRLL